MSIKWGLLWYDEEGTLDEKVQRAIDRYSTKFGVMPNACFVHPSEFGEGEKAEADIDGCKVVANPTVLEHHFWIGESIK